MHNLQAKHKELMEELREIAWQIYELPRPTNGIEDHRIADAMHERIERMSSALSQIAEVAREETLKQFYIIEEDDDGFRLYFYSTNKEDLLGSFPTRKGLIEYMNKHLAKLQSPKSKDAVSVGEGK